jgi:outer membrane lipoprotein carrier protein
MAIAIPAVMVLGPPTVAAETPEVLAGLQRWLDGTRDLECRFEQTLVSGALGSGIREMGRLYLKRPGKMRWEYTRPDPKVAILNDGVALLYLPEDRQLIRGDDDWSSSPLLLLLGGAGRLGELFRAELVAAPAGSGAGTHRLRLVPRDRGQSFEEVIVTVAASDFAIAEAEVLDDAGNRMHYRFRSAKRNRGIDDDRFVLDPPPNTEILGPS